MENNHTNQYTGTDFAELWDTLEAQNLVACSDQKTSLGAFPQPYIQDKNIVKMAMSPALKQKINQSPPIGKRSDEIWGAIHLMIKAGYSDDEIIKRIMDNPIGGKAREKSDPYSWLERQVIKARHEKASSEHFDGNQILDDTIARAQNNEPEAVFEQSFINEMCKLENLFPADFEKYRLKVKKIPGVSIGRFDKLIQANEKNEKKSSVQTFFEVLEPNIELFRDQAGKTHIAFLNDDGTKGVMLLRSSEASQQISYEIHRRTNNIIDSHALKSLIMLMEGYAANNKDVRDVFMRHAFYDGAYFIDICNDFHDVIKIDKNGVRVINTDTPLFRRTQTMKPLPYPDPQGNITPLWKYIKITKPEQLLLLSWIMECFRTNTQYPILEQNTPKGSGKSEVSRIIRAIVDPNDHDILTSPKDEEDIISAAANNAILFYDNLAKMKIDFQNLLCSIATGGSVAKRKKFTDFDLACVKILKPLTFNSISGLITQSDLADRTISIVFPKIENYIPVSELRDNFRKDYPIIFSGILDLFSRALRRIPHIKPDGKARMGDFQILGEAVSQEMGYDAGYFSKLLEQMKKDRSNSTITDSVVGTAILAFLQDKEDREEETSIQEKLISEVKSDLKAYSNDDDDWPKSEKKFSNEIRRLIPMFEDIGIKIIYHTRASGGIPITIKKVSQ